MDMHVSKCICKCAHMCVWGVLGLPGLWWCKEVAGVLLLSRSWWRGPGGLALVSLWCGGPRLPAGGAWPLISCCVKTACACAACRAGMPTKQNICYYKSHYITQGKEVNISNIISNNISIC